MGSRTALVLGSAALCMSSLPASAQQAPATHQAVVETLFSSIFTCVVRRVPQKAQALVMAPPSDTEVPDWFYDQASSCMTSLRRKVDMIRLTPYMLRGDVAKALYLEQTPVLQPIMNWPSKRKPPAERDLLTDAFGVCVVAANAAGSRGFVVAIPRSSEKRSAASALRPAFDACVQDGSDLEITGSRIRAALAVALYRAANPGAASPATGLPG